MAGKCLASLLMNWSHCPASRSRCGSAGFPFVDSVAKAILIMSEASNVGPDVNIGEYVQLTLWPCILIPFIGGSALAVIWTLVGLASVVVFARIWTQARVTYQLGLSDALMAVSLVSTASICCCPV